MTIPEGIVLLPFLWHFWVCGILGEERGDQQIAPSPQKSLYRGKKWICMGMAKDFEYNE